MNKCPSCLKNSIPLLEPGGCQNQNCEAFSPPVVKESLTPDPASPPCQFPACEDGPHPCAKHAAPPVSKPLDLEAIEARLKTADYIGKARSIAEPLIAEIRRLRATPALEASHWMQAAKAEMERRINAEAALASIAGNSCCDGCQEAKRVAQAALHPIPKGEAPEIPDMFDAGYQYGYGEAEEEAADPRRVEAAWKSYLKQLPKMGAPGTARSQEAESAKEIVHRRLCGLYGAATSIGAQSIVSELQDAGLLHREKGSQVAVEAQPRELGEGVRPSPHDLFEAAKNVILARRPTTSGGKTIVDENKRLLWLVPGGEMIALEIAASMHINAVRAQPRECKASPGLREAPKPLRVCWVEFHAGEILGVWRYPTKNAVRMVEADNQEGGA